MQGANHTAPASASRMMWDGALRAYLQAGGRLLALSYQPFPFYYADGKAVGDARRFGLPIAGSQPESSGGNNRL
ncbi:MAG: hypothetical protein KatS3mg021_2649 [Fimbriimonadales bacterium]|nr:MAG: hypothetical protein KatS3mg021_2649 [Fimbriimonadales bacterium]